MKRIIPNIKMPKLTPGSATAGEFRRVPVADVHVLDNLNLRVRGTPEYDQAVSDFAASIEANGFYDDKPLAGYVDADGKVIVVDGHRRLEAVNRLNNQSLDGDVVTDIPVVLKPEDSTLADLTVAMIQSSSGQPLTMFEKGIGVRRLMTDGMEKAEIARRLGVTEKSVDNYLAVASVSAKARDLLLDDKVTSTQVLRTKGDATKLQAMVDKAASRGRSRARPSDDESKYAGASEATGKKVLKPVTETLSRTYVPPVVRVSGEKGLTTPAAPAEPPATPTASPAAEQKQFLIVKGSDVGPVLRAIASFIRELVPHDAEEDTAFADAQLTVSLTLPEPAAKPKRSRVKAPPVTADEPLDQGGVTPAPPVGPDEPIPDELAHAIPEL